MEVPLTTDGLRPSTLSSIGDELPEVVVERRRRWWLEHVCKAGHLRHLKRQDGSWNVAGRVLQEYIHDADNVDGSLTTGPSVMGRRLGTNRTCVCRADRLLVSLGLILLNHKPDREMFPTAHRVVYVVGWDRSWIDVEHDEDEIEGCCATHNSFSRSSSFSSSDSSSNAGQAAAMCDDESVACPALEVEVVEGEDLPPTSVVEAERPCVAIMTAHGVLPHSARSIFWHPNAKTHRPEVYQKVAECYVARCRSENESARPRSPGAWWCTAITSDPHSYASAVRVSECCALKWRDVQERAESGQVTVFGKSGKTNTILLPATVWQLLDGLRGEAEPDAPVFRSRKGRHLHPTQVRRIVRAAARRAGIEKAVSPHWLRHAHCSHSLDRGAPISLVQATCSHSSVSTTGRYLHARPSDSSSHYLLL